MERSKLAFVSGQPHPAISHIIPSGSLYAVGKATVMLERVTVHATLAPSRGVCWH
jgi:hypothetical protein